MFNALDTSTSGIVAQRIRLNTIAMNIANADAVDSPDGGPYKRRSVVFSVGKNGNDGSGEGVHVSEIHKEDVFRMEFDPKHAYANKEGYVKMPGIDHLTEMVNGMEASRAYEANLTVIDLSKSMLNSSLRMLG